MKGIGPIIGVVVVSVTLVGALAYISTQQQKTPELVLNAEGEPLALEAPLSPEELKISEPVVMDETNPVAVLTTNKGVIEIELFESVMPITVGNFVKLSEQGFYDTTKFHRVIDGFMIQGGDPNSKGDNPSEYGRGGPGYTIQDEFVSDERLTNRRGTIAMANTGQPNSGGSQFFINLVDNTGLDFDKPPLQSKHPVFGQVVAGLDVVDVIAKVGTAPNDVPLEPVVIESIEIRR